MDPLTAAILVGIPAIGSLFGGGRRTTTQNTGGSSFTSGTSGSTSTGTTSTRAMPVVPQGWEDLLLGMQPGPGGLSPAQLTALSGLTSSIGGGTRALAGPAYYFSQFADNPATTLEQLYARYPDMYARPGNVDPLMVAPRTGASFMGAYTNPFEDQVVARTMNDLDKAFARRRTMMQGQLQAGGAFGGSASALQNALLDEEYFDTLMDTAGGLRSRGFEFAAGQGQSDAGRDFSGQVANQGARLTADTGNVSRLQDRQMFDVNSANENMRLRMGAVQGWGDLVGRGQALDSAALLNLMSAGGIGQGQNLAWLRAFAPLFGQENTGSTSSTGSSTTTSSGNSTGTGATTLPGPRAGNIMGDLGNTLLLMSLLGGGGGQPNFGAGGAYPDFVNPWAWAA